jgi:hypothetical protein
MVETKICNTCSLEHPLTVFYLHGKDSGKRSNKCKYCIGVLNPTDREKLDRYLKDTELEATLSIEARKTKRKDGRQNRIDSALKLAASGTLEVKSCNCCKLIFPIVDCFYIRIRKGCKDTYNGTCKFCLSVKAMESAKKNPEAKKATSIRYYQNNKDKILSNENRELRNKFGAEWRLANRNKDSQYSANNRALKNNAVPSWASKDKIDLLYLKAKEFSLVLDCYIEVDHIVPLNSTLVCGLHTEDNLQLLDKGLNILKGNREWPYMSEVTPELKQMMKEYYATN